jgi:hypothetical protein
MNKQDEKRMREIAREEIKKYMKELAKYLSLSIVPPLPKNPDDVKG